MTSLLFIFAASLPLLPEYNEDVIKEKEGKSCVGPFKVSAIKAYCSVNDDTAYNCELNYGKGLFHARSTKGKARFWRAVIKNLFAVWVRPSKKIFACVQRKCRMGFKPASSCNQADR